MTGSTGSAGRWVTALVTAALAMCGLGASVPAASAEGFDPSLVEQAAITGEWGWGGPESSSGFGKAVAVSADGGTVATGLPDGFTCGEVDVFGSTEGRWASEAALGYPGYSHGGCFINIPEFGRSVALSADGNTLLVGAPQREGAWIYHRVGGTWARTAELKPALNEIFKPTEFGASVALSADGSVALVGAPGIGGGTGAAWVFALGGETWRQQGHKLTGAGEVGAARYGSTVALSGAGTSAAIGGGTDAGGSGAVWAYARVERAWQAVGPKLTATEAIGAGTEFGTGVALSADGGTMLVSGPGDNGEAGAVWLLGREAGGWQSLQKLTGSEQVGPGFGGSIALSPDAGTVLVGGPREDAGAGAAWAFRRGLGGWAQAGGKLALSSPVHCSIGNFPLELGYAVALAEGGATAVISDTAGGCLRGTLRIFVSPPEVSALSPQSGPAAGGRLVKITGSNFEGTTAVRFGSVQATSFKVRSATLITAVEPAETAGTVDVTVVTHGMTSATSPADRFTIGPPTVSGVSPGEGAAAAGNTVVVTGSGFAVGTEGTRFDFGSAQAASVTCASPTTCEVLVPAHAAGVVEVRATVAGQASHRAAGDLYTYN